MYARIQNGAVTQWPLNETHIRNRGIPAEEARKVQPRPKPAHSPITQYVVERQPTVVDGEPVQTWEVQFHADARVRAKAAMVAWINSFLAPFTKNAADAEPHAWEKKAAAAHAYPNGTAIQTMLIEVEAGVSGETPAELCAAIKVQEELYAEIIAFTTGLRRKTVADIDAAQPADIPAILDAAQAAAIAKAQELGIA